MLKRLKQILKTAQVVFFFFVLAAPLSAIASDGSIFFSPASLSVQVNDVIGTTVFMSSPSESVNAVSGVISYNPNQIEILSLSSVGSEIDFWLQEPIFNNVTGQIRFEGIVLNPGYIGSTGKLFSINGVAKNVGSAVLSFDSASVLANDGKGTNILRGVGKCVINIGESKPSTPAPIPTVPTKPVTPTPKPTPEQIKSINLPVQPIIDSKTHPDSNKWYSNNNPELTWSLPPGVNGVSIHIDQSPSSIPGTQSDGLFSRQSYSKLEDGTWYFHIRFRNSDGWGQPTHYKIQIDTTGPINFTSVYTNEKETTNQFADFSLTANDELSGLSHYLVYVDNQLDPFQVDADLPSTAFTTAPLSVGVHQVLFSAIDRAGNKSQPISHVVTIKKVPAPKITSYTKNILSRQYISGIGDSIANAEVTILVIKNGQVKQTYIVKSDDSGIFRFDSLTKLPRGQWNLQAFVTDRTGNKSDMSDFYPVYIKGYAFIDFFYFYWEWILIPLFIIFLIIGILFDILGSKDRCHDAWCRATRYIRSSLGKNINQIEKMHRDEELTLAQKKLLKRITSDLAKTEELAHDKKKKNRR